jgi:GT2 family glycosyltransferase
VRSSSPLVSVIIVNWNGLEDTKLCLEHTGKQTYANTEIVVVDNGSQDGSADYLENLKDIKLVKNPKNLGFTGGHIAGYSVAQGEFVLLLNNDAIMQPDYIELAVQKMESDPEIGALGGRAYIWDETNELFDTSNKFYAYQNINPITAEGIFAQEDSGVDQEVNNVSGSCVMVRRSAIDKIGYLHDPFFAYYEESDLFARMKRSGFKVIYKPELAIWHANSKTSSKKAPTFSLYMMMRNRFRFAVRNFDGWSLRRFLKFYLIMGIASIIRSVTDPELRPMHKAYSKAFFYNLAFGVVPFYERWSLKKKLGASDYSRQIVKEQSPVSIAIRIDSETALNQCIALADSLDGANEIIAVTDKPELANKAKGAQANLRVCLDQGYFGTHRENLAAITAKNDWVVLSADSEIPAIEIINSFRSAIYILRKVKKCLAIMARRPINETKQVFNIRCGSTFIINKSEFIDAGGLLKTLNIDAAWRALLAYSCLRSSLLQIDGHQDKQLAPYRDGVGDILITLKGKINEAQAWHKSQTRWDRLVARYYRLAQLRNLFKWLLSLKISPRLKLARTKNMAVAAATANRQALAVELKHIQNESSRDRYSVDIVKMKEKENARLEYLTGRPGETITFIIARDRLELMKDLVAWLELQGIKKIVFVDNDSRLPTLVDYLNHTKYQVLAMGRNTLQTGIWESGIIRVLLPDDFYIVTDPDLVPTSKEKGVIKHLYEVHKRYPHHLKVGLGLKIDDIPDHYPLKEDVLKWESQFWKHELEPGVYEAGVDTTFALYKPYTYSYIIHPSVRTGEPYTARHLPWYTKANELSDEEVFYRLRLDQNVNTWNKEHLPERYKKELAKQK